MEFWDIHELFSKNWQMPFGASFCRLFSKPCDFFYMETVNTNPMLNDDARFNVYSYGHFPHGAPARSWKHYVQNAIEDRF